MIFTETEVSYIDSVIKISVIDTGVGIAKEDYDKIFHDFYRTEAALNLGSGTGLGLPITKTLVELLGGKISFSSEVGVGTQFDVTIPMKKAEIVTSNQPDLDFQLLSIDDINSFHVLLVEDNAINTMFIKESLDPFCKQITCVNNGLDALMSLDKNYYDLILMDIQIPIIDGIVTANIIRLNPKYQRVPIIAFSANITFKNEEQMKKPLFNGFICKPISKTQLLLSIREAVRQDIEFEVVSKPQIDKVLDIIFSLKSINVEKGLEYSNQDARLYLNLLAIFAEDHKKDLEKVLINIKTGKLEEEKRVLNTL